LNTTNFRGDYHCTVSSHILRTTLILSFQAVRASSASVSVKLKQKRYAS
jgi:hypothetical protein